MALHSTHRGAFGWLLGASAALWALSASASDVQPTADDSRVEGAIGLVASFGPSYPGASDHHSSLVPGGFVRFGRWTITGAGGFTTRHNDDIERGIEAELVRTSQLRLGLALRLDTGRSETRSPQLTGMGDIRSTLRSRISVRWQPHSHTTLTASVAPDLLGRDGGLQVDLSGSHQWSLGHGQLLIAGLGLSLADQRYMQTWHGITEEQALRTGRAVFRPSSGLRSVNAGLTYRHELGPSVGAFIGLGYSHLLNDAARSPLTEKSGSASISGGVAYRF